MKTPALIAYAGRKKIAISGGDIRELADLMAATVGLVPAAATRRVLACKTCEKVCLLERPCKCCSDAADPLNPHVVLESESPQTKDRTVITFVLFLERAARAAA